MTAYTLFELNEYIKRFVALNLPDAIWVSAELVSVNERRGHYYLDLIEKDNEQNSIIAQGQAVLWESTARRWQRQNKTRLSQVLQSGREVKLKVEADFHERFGLKLIISDIDSAYTLGKMEQQRQATIDHLQANQLLNLNASLSLTIVPQRLALISSPMAAGLEDFMAHLRNNPYGYDFACQLFPAAVQGVQTSVEVRRQLRTINRRKDKYDAIVIIRGGGSRMDLSDFDDRDLCIAAAQAELPIISGIGHETDQSILDMVAHTTLKTPTAAADFLIHRLLQFEQQLLTTEEWLHQQTDRIIQQQLHFLEYADQVLQNIQTQQLHRHRWQLEQYEQQLPILVNQQISKAETHLFQLERLHQLLDIKSSLNRGFSLITQSGNIINTAAALNEHNRVRIHLKDGEVDIEMT